MTGTVTDVHLKSLEAAVDFFSSSSGDSIKSSPPQHLHLQIQNKSLFSLSKIPVAGKDEDVDVLEKLKRFSHSSNLNFVMKSLCLEKVLLQTPQLTSLLDICFMGSATRAVKELERLTDEEGQGLRVDNQNNSKSSSNEGTATSTTTETARDFVLHVTDTRLQPAQVAVLSSHSVLRNVTALDLSGCHIPSSTTSSLVTLISQLANWNHVQQLVLDKIPLSATAVSCLTEWLLRDEAGACSLQLLSLEKCGLSSRNGGDAFVMQASGFQSLLSLSLAHNQLHSCLDPSEYLELAHCSVLQQLSLEGVPITATMAFMLGYVLRVSSIMSMDLSGCGLGDVALASLVGGFQYYDVMSSPPPAGERHPPFSFCPPVSEGCMRDGQTEFEEEQAVVDAFCETNHERFLISKKAKIAAVGAKAQYTSEHDKQHGQSVNLPRPCIRVPLVQDLNLSHNRFQEIGLLAPLLADRYVGLSCLTLAGNRFSPPSFIDFCRALSSADTLQSLSLSNCSLNKDLLSQLFIHLLRAWSVPSSSSSSYFRSRNHCLFPLAVTLAPSDLCCSLPGPLPGLETYNSPFLAQGGVVAMPVSREPAKSRQQWVWPHSPYWQGEHVERMEHRRSEEFAAHINSPYPDAESHTEAATEWSNNSSSEEGEGGQWPLRCVPPLRLLDLSSNSLGARGVPFLRAFFSTRPGHPLQELLLARNNLGEAGLPPLLDLLKADKSLRYITLSQRDFVSQEEEEEEEEEEKEHQEEEEEGGDGSSRERKGISRRLRRLLPSGQVVNAPDKSKVLSLLPLHRRIKYTFLLCIESAPHLRALYLPPELVRIIFSFLVCHIHRTLIIT